VIVLILVAVLWIAVLVPSVLSKLSERRSAGSIGRFHQRLDLLERTGPKLVEPAYRLTGTDSSRPSTPMLVPVTPPPVRPTLRLVSSADDLEYSADDLEYSADDLEYSAEQGRHLHEADDLDGALEEEMVELRSPGPADDVEFEYPESDAATAARDRRRLARRRRRHIFGILCSLAAITGLMGLAHPLRAAWIVAGVFVGLLIAFVGLAIYGQHIEEERRHLELLGHAQHARDEDDEIAAAKIKYLSEDDLARYRDALASYYEAEDSRLAAQG